VKICEGRGEKSNWKEGGMRRHIYELEKLKPQVTKNKPFHFLTDRSLT
jgi:hypothetical protein